MVRSCLPHAQPPKRGPPLVSCPQLLIQYIRSYPPSSPWGRAMPWWRGRIMYKYKKCEKKWSREELRVLLWHYLWDWGHTWKPHSELPVLVSELRSEPRMYCIWIRLVGTSLECSVPKIISIKVTIYEEKPTLCIHKFCKQWKGLTGIFWTSFEDKWQWQFILQLRGWTSPIWLSL
jgi:hypothetical protein